MTIELEEKKKNWSKNNKNHKNKFVIFYFPLKTAPNYFVCFRSVPHIPFDLKMCHAEHLNNLIKKDVHLALCMFQTNKTSMNSKGGRNVIYSWFNFSVLTAIIYNK